MKLIKYLPYGVGLGFVAGVASAGFLLVNSSVPSAPQYTIRHDAVVVTTTVVPHVAKSFAMLPQSSAAIKKPAIQEAVVSDPATDPATVVPTGTAVTAPGSTTATRDPNVGPPVRSGAPAGPPCWNMVDQKPC